MVLSVEAVIVLAEAATHTIEHTFSDVVTLAAQWQSKSWKVAMDVMC